jgi:hypothetical protein
MLDSILQVLQDMNNIIQQTSNIHPIIIMVVCLVVALVGLYLHRLIEVSRKNHHYLVVPNLHRIHPVQKIRHRLMQQQRMTIKHHEVMHPWHLMIYPGSN